MAIRRVPFLMQQLARHGIYRLADESLKPRRCDLNSFAIAQLVSHQDFGGRTSADVANADEQHLLKHEHPTYSSF